MFDLARQPIASRWPAEDPTTLQLCSNPTPNGVKVSVALEALQLDDEPHLVTLADSDVKSAAFLSLDPNNKIPAIIDPDRPDGAPLALSEPGAILICLAEKTGRLIGPSATERAQILQWLMFRMGGAGPMFGQPGFFYKFAGKAIEDPRPKDRYVDEARRLLNAAETRPEGRERIAGAYSVADIALAPWLQALDVLGARDAVGWADHPRAVAHLDRFLDRAAVQRGLRIPARD